MGDDKKHNEVIRVQKRPHSFVMMDKGFLENTTLSWKAKGILAYLLSKPDNWKVIVSDVIKHAADGKAAVYSGLDELRKYGYYDKIAVRSEDGRRIDHWESTVYELPKAVNSENEPTSLLPDFQEIEDQKVENQYIENYERNNNYINNNYSTDNYSQSCPSVLKGAGHENRQDETDISKQEIEDFESLIKDNINYEDFRLTNPHDMHMVDEIIFIIVDVLSTPGAYITLDGEKKPRALVKSRLMELGYENIEHVITQFKTLTTPIKRKRQYLLTMLYNSKLELDAHYTNLVQSDV